MKKALFIILLGMPFSLLGAVGGFIFFATQAGWLWGEAAFARNVDRLIEFNKEIQARRKQQ